ncbi:HD domain-containing protein [Bdellovibrio sp. BCCA]|uniref:HD domain-containing protein n=1 Tax=Bdellovibrio sp. BCCA TaxID=3136281 RepID=UPI0030F2B246
MTIESLLPFIKEIDRLKKIERQALIHNGGRRENSAEHSWHLAMTVLVLEKTSPEKIDIAKAVKMALLHDIVEIDAGDTMVYGDLSNKKDSEAAALERIMGLLPETIANEFKSLWNEFEEGVSPEAKFVSAIDRFMPIFSNYLNEGYSWKNHKVTVDKVVAKCQPPISEGLPKLWKVTERMLEESVAAGHLAR